MAAEPSTTRANGSAGQNPSSTRAQRATCLCRRGGELIFHLLAIQVKPQHDGHRDDGSEVPTASSAPDRRDARTARAAPADEDGRARSTTFTGELDSQSNSLAPDPIQLTALSVQPLTVP